ncbi:hypothetical protein COOONC_20071 [Cooperia oncophora]
MLFLSVTDNFLRENPPLVMQMLTHIPLAVAYRCVNDEWAKTSDEKATAKLEEHADVVWNILAENRDFLECRKALRE